MRGNNGWGVYFSKKKRYSQTFGDLTYKVKVCPKNTLRFDDNEVKGKGFFNMTKEKYDYYREQGYDSLVWYRNGTFKELVVLTNDIIKNIESDY